MSAAVTRDDNQDTQDQGEHRMEQLRQQLQIAVKPRRNGSV